MAAESKKNIGVFARAFQYIKENLIVGYSFFLLILVPVAFFANNYLINSDYNDAIDTITRRKADLAENIFSSFAASQLSDSSAMQSLVSRIIAVNEEIISFTVLKPGTERGVFEIVASSQADLAGQIREGNTQDDLAWNQREGIAFLDQNENGRFWKETKLIMGANNEKLGLVEMSLSIADSDAIVNNVITTSYWVLAIIVLVLVLLLANQIRLLEYALNLIKLKDVDKMKDMFISMASHELRSPLTAIKGYLDLLKSKDNLNLDSESTRYVENISVSSLRLERLVEDMLVVSRLEGNRFPIEITVFDPNPLISQSVEEMRSQALQKNLGLDYFPLLEPVLIKADANRLKQVTVNLIGNALKYTNKGSVKVTALIKKDIFQITVADTGIGISSEEQANLFQKFYRVKNESTKNIIGTGLGLWITMETVKRMNGRITVESIEGVGSHFTVHLPLAKK